MTDDFEVLILSDPDHEDLVAEISYREELCFFLSQEGGFDAMRLLVMPRASDRPWDLPLDEALKAIERAKKRLWELRRDDPPAG